MNQSIHAIDQLLFVAGPIKSVVATTATLAHEHIEVEDTAVALLEFASGAKGVIQGSTACWSKNGHAAEVQICGDCGSAFLADDKFRIWEFKEEGPEDEKIRAEQMIKDDAIGQGANDPSAISFSAHQRNFEDVVQAIQENREPLVNATEARKAVALINGIYESARNDSKKVLL